MNFVLIFFIVFSAPIIPYQSPKDVHISYNLTDNILTVTWITRSNPDVVYLSKQRGDIFTTPAYKKVMTKDQKLEDIDPQFGDIYTLHEAWVDNNGIIYFNIIFYPKFMWTQERYKVVLPLVVH